MALPFSGISVVVPIYNGQQTLRELAKRIQETLEPLGLAFELVMVNDGSMDESWNVVLDLAKNNGWIRGISLLRNYGQHSALLCGIRAARYDVCVTMDDDLQQAPEDIPLLLEKLAQGYDMVYANPKARPHGWFRNSASSAVKLVLKKVMGAEMGGYVSPFRAFRTRIRDAFTSFNDPFVSVDVLISWGTRRFAHIQVPYYPRQTGQSNYNLARLMSFTFNLVSGFSTMPLRMASIAGLGFSIFGFCILAFVVGRFFIFGSPVQGFTFLASSIAIFSGVQLLALGIMGEYLARIHLRQMQKATYIIAENSETSEPLLPGGPRLS